MKLLNTLLLLFSLLLAPVLAELHFTVEATQDGVPIPASEIKLEPFEPGTLGDKNQNSSSTAQVRGSRRLTRRSNAQANSNNWCGPVKHTVSSPSTSLVKLVHGEFVHPACTKRTGTASSYPQAAAFWVGIDGDAVTSALFQAGTVCKPLSLLLARPLPLKRKHKTNLPGSLVRNQVWWQWVPSSAYFISSMTLQAGDYMEIIVNTTSSTAGRVTINNLTRGQAYTMGITNGPALARVDAEWIVERPTYGGTLAGFARFGDLWFDNAYGKTVGGANLGILGSKQYQIPSLCSSLEYDDATTEAWAL
ncbi:Concanavalin A-like lectin/glucanase domain containing protein [Rhypophila sp. PSN 637]